MKRLLITVFLSFIFIFLSAQAQDRINTSSIAFTIPEKDLLPENVAYDSNQDAFFIGSTRKGKILRIKNGIAEEFISSKNHGLWMVIGMKIDSERRLLWVCSSGGSNLEGYAKRDKIEGRPAGIFKFNLDNGTLINKYTLENKGEIHFFNDLVIARNGDVYATHMFSDHAVYKIPSGSDKLEVFTKDPLLKYPNGISIADNQSILFIAHSEGLARLDIGTRVITNLKMPEAVKVSHRESIDGLYYYKWSLIGIQSDIGTVTRYFLNDEGDGIKETKTLEKNHPIMDHPTTGVLVGSTLYYVANSQFERISEDGVLYPMEQLYEPVILKTDLRY